MLAPKVERSVRYGRCCEAIIAQLVCGNFGVTSTGFYYPDFSGFTGDVYVLYPGQVAAVSF